MDTDEQTDKEVQRKRSGRIPNKGTSVPVKWGHVTLRVHGCVHPPGNSPNTILLGLLLRLPHRYDQLLTPFPDPLSSLENGE